MAKRPFTFAGLKAEFATLNNTIQTVLDEALETRGATEVANLSRAAGICVDRWIELDEIPDEIRQEDKGITCSHCFPESEIRDAERLFNEWLPKAYQAIKRAKAGLKATGKEKSESGNLVAWMTAAGIGAQKVAKFHMRLSQSDQHTQIWGAHRHELAAVMEKLNLVMANA